MLSAVRADTVSVKEEHCALKDPDMMRLISSVLAAGKDDAERSYTGKLEKQEYNGHNYVGFKANFAKGSGNGGSSNKANATGMTCPRCGKPINKLTWGYGCSGYSSGCSFRVGNTFNGKKLTDKQIRDLITNGKTSKPVTFSAIE